MLDSYFRNVVCDLEHDICCEALSSVSSALAALRDQSEGSTPLCVFCNKTFRSTEAAKKHAVNNCYEAQELKAYCDQQNSTATQINSNKNLRELSCWSQLNTFLIFILEALVGN